MAAEIKSSLKVLAKILTGAFKLADKTLKYMDNLKFKFKNTSGYWVTKNKDYTYLILIISMIQAQLGRCIPSI